METTGRLEKTVRVEGPREENAVVKGEGAVTDRVTAIVKDAAVDLEAVENVAAKARLRSISRS